MRRATSISGLSRPHRCQNKKKTPAEVQRSEPGSVSLEQIYSCLGRPPKRPLRSLMRNPFWRPVARKSDPTSAQAQAPATPLHRWGYSIAAHERQRPFPGSVCLLRPCRNEYFGAGF